MKITNVSAKVIGILGKDLMPDASMEITKETLANGSVAALIEMGFLKLDNSAEQAAAMKEALRAELLAEMEAEEKPKKRGRKKASDEAEAEAAIEE